MPFVLERFDIQGPAPAYKVLMNVLGLDMSEAQRYINKGRVVYNNETLTNNQKNKILDTNVEVLIFKPERLGVEVIFENDDFILFNKPEKLLVHPKGRFYHYSLIDEIKSVCGNQASLIHRIDKETSGLVLVGKHKNSIKELGDLFVANKIEKEYLVVARGIIKKDLCVSTPISMQDSNCDLGVRSVFLGQLINGSILTRKDQGFCFKDARSEFEVLGYIKGNTLLKARIYTGRTHQIRLHLYSIGHPVLGDPLYGCDDTKSREYLDCEFKAEIAQSGMDCDKRIEYFGADRLMLHSYTLKFSYKNVDYTFRVPFDVRLESLVDFI